MPRGVPLTPEQLRKAAEVFEQTGNYSEAARAAGTVESVVRARLKNASRRELHARAIDRGIREGRRALRQVIAQAQALLARECGAKELDALARATSLSVQRLLDLRSAPLERAKLRADAKVSEAKAKGLLPPDVTVVNVTREDADRLFERAFSSTGALPTGDAVDPAATESIPPVVGAAVPVPEALDR